MQVWRQWVSWYGVSDSHELDRRRLPATTTHDGDDDDCGGGGGGGDDDDCGGGGGGGGDYDDDDDYREFEICVLSPYCGLVENASKSFQLCDQQEPS